MNQLDLFSSGPKPETSEKKEVKKANESANEKTVVPDTLQVEVKQEEVSEEEFFEEEVSVDPIAEIVPVNNAVTEISGTSDAFVFIDEPVPSDEPVNVALMDSQEIENDAEKPVEKQEEEQITVAPSIPIRRSADGRILQKRGRKSFKEMNAEVDLIDIPEDDILYKKQYYSISEVAGWFNVNTSLLRYWETEFDVLKPRKNRKGDRMFRPEDVKNLQLIYHLLRDRKYTIDGAKDYIKGNRKKADSQLQITQSLQKFKSFLLELKANLQ